VVGELIGEGHFARVYAAGADAALKILRDDVDDDVLGKGWYQVLSVPAHPGLVKTLALAEDRRSVLMERGESDLFAALWERGMRGITSPLQIARALLDVGAALRHLHEHGVAHRDVKPENILLRWQNGSCLRAFLTDFDFAVANRRLPVSHVAGTLKYVPRSQRQMTDRYRAACKEAGIEGRPAPREPSYSTFASDAYAFTVVIIETLVKDAAWSDCHDSIAPERFLAPLDTLAATYGPRLGAAVQLCLAIPCDTHQLALERVLSVVLTAAGF
jgi:serine/threonine protein kinase